MKANNFWDRSYTPVCFPHGNFILTIKNRSSFWGSCFAQELGEYYGNLGLSSYTSPFGIIYNPITMADSLSMLLKNELRGEPFYHSRLWRHDAFHSSCCFTGEEDQYDQAKNHFRQNLFKGHKELLDTDILVITLGTAFVYQKKQSGLIVNNCHKQANNLFQRMTYLECLDQEDSLLTILLKLKEKNRSLNVILTVSPVRHLRDDARENSYSKSLLRCLCEDLCRVEFIHYFPSYEIVLDELRDYRWFNRDLCHPSAPAVEYVMNRFFQWCADRELLDYIEVKKKERKHNSHRPLI